MSSLGRIKSFKRHKTGKILKQSLSRYGYLLIELSMVGITKKMSVHRLVAKEFIPNYNNLPQINHKDENKINNKINNLEWITNRDNVIYSQAKTYTIKFPDKHIEKYFCLENFCQKYNLNKGCMQRSFTKGYYHKGFQILEIIEKDGIIKKQIEQKRKSFSIQFPDGHIEIIHQLKIFCQNYNLNYNCIRQTFVRKTTYKKFQIIAKK